VFSTIDLAFGPVVNPGKGCNVFRVVLRCDYKDGNPEKFFTHRQYLFKGEDDDTNKDKIFYADGNYFPVYNNDLATAYARAVADWENRVKRSVTDWPLASSEDITRFLNDLKK
jgi:hypothetical protein